MSKAVNRREFLAALGVAATAAACSTNESTPGATGTSGAEKPAGEAIRPKTTGTAEVNAPGGLRWLEANSDPLNTFREEFDRRALERGVEEGPDGRLKPASQESFNSNAFGFIPVFASMLRDIETQRKQYPSPQEVEAIQAAADYGVLHELVYEKAKNILKDGSSVPTYDPGNPNNGRRRGNTILARGKTTASIAFVDILKSNNVPAAVSRQKTRNDELRATNHRLNALVAEHEAGLTSEDEYYSKSREVAVSSIDTKATRDDIGGVRLANTPLQQSYNEETHNIREAAVKRNPDLRRPGKSSMPRPGAGPESDGDDVG